MTLGYGFSEKRIKGKLYTYFWAYDGEGHKTETYMGPSGKPATERKAHKLELDFLTALRTQLATMIKQLQKAIAEP